MDNFTRFLDRLKADDVITDLRHRAYVLATVRHECAGTWLPIIERGAREYFTRYEGRADLGNVEPGDGYKYRGRGFSMITGLRNYKRFGIVLGIDLIEQPELALEDAIAYRILTIGMSRGMFTGRRLADYIHEGGTDYLNARRVINRMDKAELIAGYAVEYEHMLASRNAGEPS